MKIATLTSTILVIVGGLNWGLVGLFDFNLVDSLFGEGSGLSRVVYVLVGIAALCLLALLPSKLSTSED